MAENLIIGTGNKEDKYRELLPQLHALVSTETDLIANLANVAAALKQTFGFFWVGFYLVKEDELVLGPFQGPIACSSDSKSEIVVPVLQQGEVIGVLDIDSNELDSFDTIDARYLEEICTYIG